MVKLFLEKEIRFFVEVPGTGTARHRKKQGNSVPSSLYPCTTLFKLIEQLLKPLSQSHGLPWRSVEEHDSAALVGAVERILIKPDGLDVVMKYLQAANS